MQRVVSFRIWAILALATAVVCTSAVAFWVRSRTAPKLVVQRALGIALPRSASHTMVSWRWVQDSRVVKLWAVMDISLEEAQVFASDLRLPATIPSTSISLPDPDPIPVWWVSIRDVDLAALPAKWLREGPDLRPALFAMVWSKGKLYVFYHGICGAALGTGS